MFLYFKVCLFGHSCGTDFQKKPFRVEMDTHFTKLCVFRKKYEPDQK